MESKSVRNVCAAAGVAARYEPKLKLWFFAEGQPNSTSLTAQELYKMKPDGLRRKLGVQKAGAPPRKAAARKRGSFSPEAKISLLVRENPKRAGSLAAVQYALYRDGMSVAEFLSLGGTYRDLRWDAEHKFISLSA